MKSEVILHVSTRMGQDSKGNLNNMRANGIVPGVIYGHGNISVNQKEMDKYMASGAAMSKVISMCFEKEHGASGCSSEDIMCILRDVQYDAVTEEILHVDFQKVAKGMPIKVKVDVRFSGHDKCVAIKRGAVVNTLCNSMLIRCMPEAIPQSISVDISEMTVGRPLHINDISLPKGVTPVDPSNFTIAVLSGIDGEDDDAAGKSDEASAAA